MNFDPASGYEAALGVLRRFYIPTRDKNEAQPPNRALGVVTYSQTPATAMSYSPSDTPIHAAGHLAATTDGQTLRHHNLPPPHDKVLLNRPFDVPSSSIQGSPYRSNDSITSIPLPPHRIESRANSTSDGRLEGQIKQRSGPPFADTISKTGFASRITHNPLEGTAQSNVTMGPPAERPRPLTSPLHYQCHDTLTELHPPKRILPFPEVPLQPAQADPIEEGPDGDTLKIESKSVLVDATKRSSKEKTKIQKSKKSSSTGSKSARAVSSSGPVRTTAKTPRLPTSSAPNLSSMKSRVTKANNRKASPIVEEEIAESSDQPPSSKTRRLSKSKRSTATKTKEALPEAVMETYMESVDAFVRKHAPRSAPCAPDLAPVSDLEGYAKMPESKRLEALDELIMKYIEDDNFVTLCEDVEKCWKRVGLTVLSPDLHRA